MIDDSTITQRFLILPCRGARPKVTCLCNLRATWHDAHPSGHPAAYLKLRILSHEIYLKVC